MTGLDRGVRDKRWRAVVVGVLALLSWGVLVFAAVYRWASIPLAIGCTVVGGWALLTRSAHPNGRMPRALSVAFAALCVAVGLQIVPLPIGVLRDITPATDAFLRDYHIGYSSGNRQPISLEPEDTTLALCLLVSFGLLMFGAVRQLTSRAVESIARGIAVLGALVALEGVVQRAISTETIYGFWRPHTPGVQTFGPFVNRNHFAGWMLMALPLTIGYLFAIVERNHVATRSWRQRVVWLGSPAASHALLVGSAIIVMALALVLTLSRSGIGCFLVALIVWVLATGRRSDATISGRAAAITYLLAIGVVSATWIGTSTIATRFAGLGSGANDVSRILAWGDAVRVVKAFPLTGTGVNAYDAAILSYDSHTTEKFFGQVHNDYLQLAAEGGLLVGVPAVATVLAFAGAVRRRFTRDDVRSRWLRLGAVTGLVAVALQELVDFSLQIPGNAVLFTILAAIALHRATLTESSRTEPAVDVIS